MLRGFIMIEIIVYLSAVIGGVYIVAKFLKWLEKYSRNNLEATALTLSQIYTETQLLEMNEKLLEEYNRSQKNCIFENIKSVQLAINTQREILQKNQNSLSERFSNKKILFSPDCEFFDVEGIPVTLGNVVGLKISCAAWDVDPPRQFSSDSTRRNGAPITEKEFIRMIKNGASLF